jgi:hypothetical protein
MGLWLTRPQLAIVARRQLEMFHSILQYLVDFNSCVFLRRADLSPGLSSQLLALQRNNPFLHFNPIRSHIHHDDDSKSGRPTHGTSLFIRVNTDCIVPVAVSQVHNVESFCPFGTLWPFHLLVRFGWVFNDRCCRQNSKEISIVLDS